MMDLDLKNEGSRLAARRQRAMEILALFEEWEILCEECENPDVFTLDRLRTIERSLDYLCGFGHGIWGHDISQSRELLQGGFNRPSDLRIGNSGSRIEFPEGGE